MNAADRPYVVDEVVTGEAVAVEVPVVPVVGRIGAGLVDAIVAGLPIWLTLYLLSGTLADLSEITIRTVATLVVITFAVAVPATLETLTQGYTLGKRLLGQRVVRDDGGPITARQAITRALIGFVEKVLTGGVVATTTAFLAPKSKRLGDLAAGTVVVSQRTRFRLEDPPFLRPALAPWAAAADIGELPPGLAVAIRQFLARANTLTPTSRARVGAELLAATLPHVQPPPPPADPEQVLAAVLVRRRDRDLARLRRGEERRAALLPPDPLDADRRG